MVRPPTYLRFLYPEWCGINLPTKRFYILTFDDGPTPEVTTAVLDLLSSYQAKATFFCIGENVKKHPTLYNRIIEEGHTIGNHTHTHPNSWKVKYDFYLEDVEEARKVIDSNLFRPPYGKLTPRTLFALRNKYQIIMWDVISCDFDERVSAEQVEKNVLENATNGSIIVFHDSVKAAPRMLEVLPAILKHYTELGFSFLKL
jgi:peptidoglycan/xylan/chitin deacetylase (PgdA/CDA1 family)